MDGIDILRRLCEWCFTPILALSEKSADETKTTALDAGASDYLAKPFSGTELLARLRVLRRPLPNVPDGPLLIEGVQRVLEEAACPVMVVGPNQLLG